MFDEPLAFSPDQFSGTARVFPIPNLVMFPHVMQALHVFEPRYKALLEESVEDDRMMALAVHDGGPGQHEEDRPLLNRTSCLCRVATHQQTSEGTYNVLLLGVCRLRLLDELPPDRPFRVFEAEVIDEREPEQSEQAVASELQKKLLSAFKRSMPKMPEAYDQLDQLLGNQITLGMLADIVSYTLDLGVEWKMRLLGECDVLRRTSILLEAMAGRSVGGNHRPFPPLFSNN
ncbi:MAG: LON peptidase substrate-binding domain-containing protein [Pirellulales bacterium]